MIDRKEIKKILVIRYRFIGDTVLVVPFIKNLRQHFLDSVIHVLASPNSGEILEGNPDINKVIYYNNTDFHKYEKANSSEEKTTYNSFFECVKGIKSEKYDAVFVLKRSFSSALMAFLAKIKYRIGFDTELRSFLLTHTVKYNKNRHESENFLNCLLPLDTQPVKYTPEIFPTEREKSRANGFLLRLEKFKPKILIHASSAHPYKKWPKRYFANLMDNLYERYNAQFIFTGAEVDKEVYEEILSWCKNKSKFKILDLCGLLSLRECYSLYKGLDMAICTDSGNAHLSGASGTLTYVLYGPTKPECWLPLGKRVYPLRLNQLLPCQPCNLKIDCTHLSCMKLLTPDIVLQNLNKGKTTTEVSCS